MDEITREALAICDLTCPICGGVNTLEKRVNETHDEIWACRDCPAVLFTYWYPEQIDRLYAVLHARKPRPPVGTRDHAMIHLHTPEEVST